MRVFVNDREVVEALTLPEPLGRRVQLGLFASCNSANTAARIDFHHFVLWELAGE